MFPFTVVPAYNLPVYASQRPLPDATQDSVRGCSLGFAAAVVADGRLQRACKAQPAQIPACAANAPGSSLGFWRRSDERQRVYSSDWRKEAGDELDEPLSAEACRLAAAIERREPEPLHLVEEPPQARVVIFVNPVRDESGTVEHFASFVDITKQKQETAHSEMMIEELNHRVKNTLSTAILAGFTKQCRSRGSARVYRVPSFRPLPVTRFVNPRKLKGRRAARPRQ